MNGYQLTNLFMNLTCFPILQQFITITASKCVNYETDVDSGH